MNYEIFSNHLNYILTWWESFIDWEKGGVFTSTKYLKKESGSSYKNPLMHLRQLYNYSVGFEQGYPGSEKIAHHLYDTLYQIFPERQNGLMISTQSRGSDRAILSSYLNAYQVICLSRYARAFHHRPAAELALKVYHEMDQLFTDGDLADQGTWNDFDIETQVKTMKTDNAHIHRCEGALNLLRALKIINPVLAKQETAYLTTQIKDLCTFFDRRIARSEEGYTLEYLSDDATPPEYYPYHAQSLAHGFEWMGFCMEIEKHCGFTLPFTDSRLRFLAANTLDNGLAPNGCFRNGYVAAYNGAPLQAEFWPQVEAILGALWARKQWGEKAFPLEKSQRMLDFYQRYFIIPDSLGGGIAASVSENGIPINLRTGFSYKCDHHAVRLVEKTLEYDLLGVHPA